MEKNRPCNTVNTDCLGVFIPFDASISTPLPRKHAKKSLGLESLCVFFPVWWNKRQHYPKNPLAKLDKEIFSLLEYLGPTQKEAKKHFGLLREIHQTAKTLFSDKTKLLPLGKYKIQMLHPLDTIQMTFVLPAETKIDNDATQLRNALLEKKMFEAVETVQHSGQTTLLLRSKEISVQLFFDAQQEIQMTALLSAWKAQIPGFDPLCRVVDAYLAARNLTDPAAGGLSFKAIAVMVQSFLCLHPGIQLDAIDPLENIGLLFVEFLELYGLCLNTEKVAVVSGGYQKKSTANPRKEILTVLDPLDNTLVLTKGCHQWPAISHAFSHSFYILCSVLKQSQTHTKTAFANASVLATVLDDTHRLFT